MNLKDYFNQQKDLNVSRYDMLNIYEKVLTKKHNKMLARKSNFLHARSFLYSLIVLFFFVGIYGVYFFNGNISLNDNGLIIQRLNTSSLVSADYVAKVVDFNGNFYIQHGDQYYQSSNIADWDTVILQKWTEITFDINAWAKAKLLWPAKFVLKKGEDSNGQKKYSIVLSYWDFIQMNSVGKSTDTMELYVDNLKINTSKWMNFQIQKKDDRYDIKNQWSELIVLQNNTQTIALKDKQALSIQDNNVVLFENIKDFAQALTTANVSQTFSLHDDALVATATTWTSPTTMQLALSTLSESSSTEEPVAGENDSLLASQLWITSDKEILPVDKATSVQWSLTKTSLTSLTQKLYVAYVAGNQTSFDASYSTLVSKIKKSYDAFWLSFSQVSWSPAQKLSALSSNIDTLYAHVTTSYHISDMYLTNLQTLKNWLGYIQKTTYWSDTSATRETLSAIPSTLYFK